MLYWLDKNPIKLLHITFDVFAFANCNQSFKNFFLKSQVLEQRQMVSDSLLKTVVLLAFYFKKLISHLGHVKDIFKSHQLLFNFKNLGRPIGLTSHSLRLKMGFLQLSYHTKKAYHVLHALSGLCTYNRKSPNLGTKTWVFFLLPANFV